MWGKHIRGNFNEVTSFYLENLKHRTLRFFIYWEEEIMGNYMKIRQTHPILDRIKLIIVLVILLIILGNLVQYLEQRSTNQKISTMEKLFQTALKPVGSTMYIWGGGWNDEDNAAGATSTQIGLYPQWGKFADQQDETYDFKEHRFERENGLDCSGYVGWVIYNTFENEDGQSGYVTTSTDMAENFANRGWGEFMKNPKEFLPGDIVSMEGHVWICLGTCEDGSVLLIHSSPPGVSICGTQVEGKEHTIAIELATKYMETYYPNWQKKYPNRTVPSAYLKNVSLMRWNRDTLIDAKMYQDLSGEEIIERISPEK